MSKFKILETVQNFYKKSSLILPLEYKDYCKSDSEKIMDNINRAFESKSKIISGNKK